MKNIIVIVFLIYSSCDTKKELIITPIKVVTYIDYGVQYFDVDNYSNQKDSILINKLLLFSEQELSKNSQMPPKVMTQHFYRKTLFSGCNKKGLLYEEDLGESQDIRECNEAHIAAILIYKPTEDKKNDSIFKRDITIWSNGKPIKDPAFPGGNRRIVTSRVDSILIKGSTWKIIKKGEIERNN